MKSPRVYCSGPLFCPEERAAMSQIAQALEVAGYATFLPQRDGLEAFFLGAAGSAWASGVIGRAVSRAANRAIFALDVYEVVAGCDALVINLNGRVPDEGAVSEAAIAFASGTPVVAYKNDARSLVAGLDNAMVLGLSGGFEPINTIGALPPAVERALADSPHPRDTPPPRVASVIAQGRRIRKLLDHWRRAGWPQPEAVDATLIDALQEAPAR